MKGAGCAQCSIVRLVLARSLWREASQNVAQMRTLARAQYESAHRQIISAQSPGFDFMRPIRTRAEAQLVLEGSLEAQRSKELAYLIAKQTPIGHADTFRELQCPHCQACGCLAGGAS